jgi:hypothetical protein
MEARMVGGRSEQAVLSFLEARGGTARVSGPEVAREYKVHPSSVLRSARVLADKGILERDPESPHTFRIAKPSKPARSAWVSSVTTVEAWEAKQAGVPFNSDAPVRVRECGLWSYRGVASWDPCVGPKGSLVPPTPTGVIDPPAEPQGSEYARKRAEKFRADLIAFQEKKQAEDAALAERVRQAQEDAARMREARLAREAADPSLKSEVWPKPIQLRKMTEEELEAKRNLLRPESPPERIIDDAIKEWLNCGQDMGHIINDIRKHCLRPDFMEKIQPYQILGGSRHVIRTKDLFRDIQLVKGRDQVKNCSLAFKWLCTVSKRMDPIDAKTLAFPGTYEYYPIIGGPPEGYVPV